MGAGEWIALGSLVAVGLGAAFALGRYTAKTPAATRLTPATEERIRGIESSLREAERYRWPIVLQALDRQSSAIDSAAASIESLRDLAAQLLGSRGPREP